jgi:hypothetical protein
VGRDLQTSKERPAQILLVVRKHTFVDGDELIDPLCVSYVDQLRSFGE